MFENGRQLLLRSEWGAYLKCRKVFSFCFFFVSSFQLLPLTKPFRGIFRSIMSCLNAVHSPPLERITFATKTLFAEMPIALRWRWKMFGMKTAPGIVFVPLLVWAKEICVTFFCPQHYFYSLYEPRGVMGRAAGRKSEFEAESLLGPPRQHNIKDKSSPW